MIIVFIVAQDAHRKTSAIPHYWYNIVMNPETVTTLNRLNNSFYLSNCESFSQTRQGAWSGWKQISKHFVQEDSTRPYHVLDIACGNMRFEKFLVENLPEFDFQFECIDSCDELTVPMEDCTYRNRDIIQDLMRSESAMTCWGQDFDAVVSFGFFHHVPSMDLRMRLLEMLADTAKPGGLIAISLWRFASDGSRRAKAERTTAEALATLSIPGELEQGDYLLGWNDIPGVYRYCHSFDDEEVTEIISSGAVRISLVDRFRADGRTGASNEYLVFRKL